MEKQSKGICCNELTQFVMVKIDLRKSNAKYLINAFFKNFNHENAILIKDNTAYVKISTASEPNLFDIMYAVSEYDIIELQYGSLENSTNNVVEEIHNFENTFSEEKTTIPKEEPDDEVKDETNEVAENVAEEVTEITEENATEKSQGEMLEKNEEGEMEEISETEPKADEECQATESDLVQCVENLAKEAVSKEKYVEAIADKLKFAKTAIKEDFSKLCLCAINEYEATKELKMGEIIQKAKIGLNHKNVISMHVNNKLNKYYHKKGHMLKRLVYIVATTWENIKKVEITENTTESKEKRTLHDRPTVNCDIAECFWQNLAQTNFEELSSPKEKFMLVLDELGIANLQQTAVHNIYNEIDIMLNDTKNAGNLTLEVRMDISILLNKYNEKYGSGKLVRLDRFLEAMREVI